MGGDSEGSSAQPLRAQRVTAEHAEECEGTVGACSGGAGGEEIGSGAGEPLGAAGAGRGRQAGTARVLLRPSLR